MIWGIRALFILFSGLIGLQLADLLFTGSQVHGFFGGVFAALFFVSVEIGFTRRYISIISVVMVGVIVGFVVSSIVINALFLVPWLKAQDVEIRNWIEFGITFIFCYLAVVIILQTKDDLKFVVPYIEFQREGRGGVPLVLDASAIIDGRIADIAATPLLSNPIVIPRFVIDEVQAVADAKEPERRARGRRGLEVINRLRSGKNMDVRIDDSVVPGVEGIDAKLVRLARVVNGRVITADAGLNKAAHVEGVELLNINDVAIAFRAVHLPGEGLTVKVVRTGQEPEQGVGYLEDGTMVVIDGAAKRVGEALACTITNLLQTAAGRIIFAQLRRAPEAGGPRPAAN